MSSALFLFWPSQLIPCLQSFFGGKYSIANYVPGEHQKVTSISFVDISCMHILHEILHNCWRNNVYFITKFCWNISENDKIMLFNQDSSPFLSIPSSVFTGSLLVALKRAGLLAARWVCRFGEMDRVIADTQSDHHWQPQPCRQSSIWWNSPPPF